MTTSQYHNALTTPNNNVDSYPPKTMFSYLSWQNFICFVKISFLGRLGGTAQRPKKIYRPRAIFNIPGPPWSSFLASSSLWSSSFSPHIYSHFTWLLRMWNKARWYGIFALKYLNYTTTNILCARLALVPRVIPILFLSFPCPLFCSWKEGILSSEAFRPQDSYWVNLKLKISN